MVPYTFGSARALLDCDGQFRPPRLPIMFSQIGPDNDLRNEIEMIEQIQRDVGQKFFGNALVQLAQRDVRAPGFSQPEARGLKEALQRPALMLTSLADFPESVHVLCRWRFARQQRLEPYFGRQRYGFVNV